MKHLLQLVDEQVKSNGLHESGIRGVNYFKVSCQTPRLSIIYQPSIVFVLQGAKKGYLGERVFHYDASHYMILAIPMPLETQVIRASPEKPLLSIDVGIDRSELASLLTDMNIELESPGELVPCSTQSTPINEAIINALTRLVECAGNPEERKILGPHIKRELFYRALRGEHGECLKALMSKDSKFNKIVGIVDLIHSNYGDPFDVETMAKTANMSVSSFHHNFKKVTSLPPLQYIKNIRLHKARELIVEKGLNVNSVAEKVGYVSTPQFSREFKRFFGINPSAFTN